MIAITEKNGDGGDLQGIEVIDGDAKYFDIDLDFGLLSMAYLSLFGGNIEADTTGNEKPGYPRSDFWGNQLIADVDAQFNSSLERALLTLPIVSSNIIKFEDAAKFDLKWMIDRGHAESVDVSINIIAVDRVSIAVYIKEPESNARLKGVWDYMKSKKGAGIYAD